MSNQILALVVLPAIGIVCANSALLFLKMREQLGFPDHQVLKRRRLPSDANSRGGPFYILFGAMTGSCVALSHGLQPTTFFLIASSCSLGGLIISKQRVLKLGEAYLKRAYTHAHAKEYAAAIQDAMRHHDVVVDTATRPKSLLEQQRN